MCNTLIRVSDHSVTVKDAPKEAEIDRVSTRSGQYDHPNRLEMVACVLDLTDSTTRIS